jgi:hypothetical protein
MVLQKVTKNVAENAIRAACVEWFFRLSARFIDTNLAEVKVRKKKMK